MSSKIARSAWLGVMCLVACAVDRPPEVSTEVAEALSPNPCTTVALTAPAPGFTATPGVPVVLTGAATCPVGQTPQYQYWFKQFAASNWTILGPYVPGSSAWTPPAEDHWCVTVVVRAVGAPESYQARSSARCNTPRCGNGVVDAGEQCDDGNFVNGDGCDVNCTVPSCGNGILDTGEQCEDGNTTDGDGCEADCSLPRCGNGVLDHGEQCDDGNATNGDACDTNCTAPRCGNGAVDPGEECDDGNATNGDTCDVNCTAPRCGNAAVDPGEECDDGNANNGDGCDTGCALGGLSYLKASNPDPFDLFGGTVAISGDGSTLAVSARLEASAATGIDGDQASNAAPDAGAVYLYVRSGGTWVPQAYVKASNTDPGDGFGNSVALSADGATLVVGAPYEDSLFGGINGNQADNSVGNAGAAYVFTRSGTTWTQQAYVKAQSANQNGEFGWSVTLAADGSTLAVASVIDSVVFVFVRSGTTWSQQAELSVVAGDLFGWSLALSGDGTTLAIGAIDDDSAATGINGDPLNNNASNAGAAYVFTRSGVTWTQQAYIKASNTGRDDAFGTSVALSGDGSTLAVGAIGEDSNATGINGNQVTPPAPGAGAVYLFTRAAGTWSQQAYVKASNTGALDHFGDSVALSADGNRLAVGARSESSAATGIDGNQGDDSAAAAGAVYRFTRSGTAWSQAAYVKAPNTDGGDVFGTSVSLSADASALAVGAQLEASAATGVGGNQGDNSVPGAGAVYVFR